MNNKVYDCIIYGSGAAALGAAFRMISENRKVLLITPNGHIGSEMTKDLMPYLMREISQCAAYLFNDLEKRGAAKDYLVDPCAALIRMFVMLDKKADVLFYARPAGITVENGVVKGLVSASKSGISAMRAKVFLDCSDTLEMVNCAEPSKIAVMEKKPDSVFTVCAALEKDVETPDEFGKDIEISRSFWNLERVIEIRNGGRGSLRNFVSDIREKCSDVFGDTVFSHASFSAVPFATKHLSGSLKYRNLFASEETESFYFENRRALFSVRLSEGERLADTALKVIDSIPAPDVLRDVRTVSNGVAESCDILIAGGGTAGAIAAIAAGRQGAKTVIYEAMDYLGGIATGGALNGYYYGLPGGLQDEVDDRVYDCSRLFYGKKHGALEKRLFHPVAKMLVLEEMTSEANVEVCYNRMIHGLETSLVNKGNLPESVKTPVADAPRKVERVESTGDGGAISMRAKVYIDATGDGDLAVFAGAKYTAGRDPDAIQHIYSIPAIHLTKREDKDAAGAVTRKYLTLIPYNIDAGYCDACDIWDVSRARISAIRGFDRKMYIYDAHVLFFSAVLGARASRQIEGRVKIGLSDQIASSEFNDVIGYSASHYDNHAKDYENESLNAMLWTWALDAHNEPIGCEIPYRAMLPRGIENMIVSCRALSLEFDANLQFRMQRDMQRIGEAAGLAAAIAVKDDVVPEEINIPVLQKQLFKTGALVDSEKNYHSNSWKPDGYYPDRRIFELENSTYVPARKMIGTAADEYRSLERALDDSDDAVRYLAALKLATGARNEKALAMLVDCINNRIALYPPKSWQFRSAPFWKIALGVCGAAGYVNAREAVINVINDPKSDQQSLILAVRALAKIGDAKSADAIEKMLVRPGLERVQTFHNWGGDTGDFIDDSSWKLDFASYETLAKLGRKRDDLIEKYSSDNRGYVHRASERVVSRVLSAYCIGN